MAWQEFELANYDVIVQHINQYAIETPPGGCFNDDQCHNEHISTILRSSPLRWLISGPGLTWGACHLGMYHSKCSSILDDLCLYNLSI